ncbi:protein kinase [Actinomadura sp. LD22]|uniref:non-specific serine/threonine protein kinase n=2 Tax=Actinomadura physcomitrii TaxID=2650748 RepID=A0A6I4MFY3_9ACTN|nr:protein kinase [Actinomadura physcomitrii]
MRGGSGEVWLAADERLGRRVALKRALLDGDEAAFTRLRREARALAKFSHPHVVTLYDAVRTGTRGRAAAWLVMEYVPGGSLAAWPPLPAAAAARVGAQIADALAALHAAGIVHCDVKPGNIVVTEDGTAKLADFGAAYRTGGRETITPSGAVAHTPAFAAPELVAGRPEPASDVYSLGATVLALTTGEPPARDGGGPVAGPAGEPLAGIVAAMVRDDPAERPAPAEVRALLDEAAGQAEPQLPMHLVPTVDGPDGPDGCPAGDADAGWEPSGGPGAAWRKGTAFARRRPRLLMAGAAVAAVAVALALTPLFSGGGSADQPEADRTGTAAGASLIGDPRTADPCALASAAALGRFGDTDLDGHYGNFDRCDVLVSSRKDGLVDVMLEFDDRADPEPGSRTRTVGRIGVEEEPPGGDECVRTLRLPGKDAGTAIDVVAQQEDGGPAQLCAIADVAAAGATAVLNRGALPRRSPPLDAASLARQDACTLLDARALDVVPGIDATDPRVDFARWGCSWHSTTRDIQVKLRFDQGQPLTADDGRPTVLGGFHTYVDPGGDGDGSCLARLVYRTHTARYGGKAVEVVNVVVQGKAPSKQRCSLATTLASSAARSLPAPR